MSNQRVKTLSVDTIYSLEITQTKLACELRRTIIESEVMVTRPIRWEEPLQNCIQNKGRRINKYLTAIMTLPFAGAHGTLAAITHTKINTKIAPAKKCNFQELTVNS